MIEDFLIVLFAVPMIALHQAVQAALSVACRFIRWAERESRGCVSDSWR